MLHAGSHAFIRGIDLLPMPTGSSHPYLIPARTYQVPTVHAGSRACMDQVHTRTIPMRACTGSPRMHTRRMTMRACTGSPCMNACTQDSHACTHRVPMHERRTPMRTRTGSPCTCMHSTDPLPMHTGSPRPCQTPMCVRTRWIPACTHAPGLTTHAGTLDSHACTHQVVTHARTPGPCMHSVFWDCSCSTVDIYVVDRILIKALLTLYGNIDLVELLKPYPWKPSLRVRVYP